MNFRNFRFYEQVCKRMGKTYKQYLNKNFSHVSVPRTTVWWLRKKKFEKNSSENKLDSTYKGCENTQTTEENVVIEENLKISIQSNFQLSEITTTSREISVGSSRGQLTDSGGSQDRVKQCDSSSAGSDTFMDISSVHGEDETQETSLTALSDDYINVNSSCSESSDDDPENSVASSKQPKVLNTSGFDFTSSGGFEDTLGPNSNDLNETAATDTSHFLLENSACKCTSVSQAEVLSMVISFTLRHHLSDTALLDLVQLINCMFGKGVLPNSMYMMKKILGCHRMNPSLHFFCTKCHALAGMMPAKESNLTCTFCGHEISRMEQGNYFITIPVKEQVRQILQYASKEGFVLHQSAATPHKDKIQDIQSGMGYSKTYRYYIKHIFKTKRRSSLST